MLHAGKISMMFWHGHILQEVVLGASLLRTSCQNSHTSWDVRQSTVLEAAEVALILCILKLAA